MGASDALSFRDWGGLVCAKDLLLCRSLRATVNAHPDVVSSRSSFVFRHGWDGFRKECGVDAQRTRLWVCPWFV